MTALTDRLWDAVEPVLFISKEEFLKNLDGWKIEPVEIDGEVAFITLVKGPAFHFQSCGTRHQITRKMITAFLQKIIAEQGYATTKTPKEDVRQHRFNLLFGFEVVGDDDFYLHYKIERLPKCL